jgi:hypothetical protein
VRRFEAAGDRLHFSLRSRPFSVFFHDPLIHPFMVLFFGLLIFTIIHFSYLFVIAAVGALFVAASMAVSRLVSVVLGPPR